MRVWAPHKWVEFSTGAVGRKCNGCSKVGHYFRVCPNNKESGANLIEEKNTSSVHVAQINKAFDQHKAPTVVVGIHDLQGRKLGKSEALLDTGADASIADQRFLHSIGLKKKDLKKTFDNRIRGATQNYFKQLGTITLKLSYGGNTVIDTITIVDGQLVVPILIRWNSTAALLNDLTYPLH